MRLTAERTDTESLFETLTSKSPAGLYIIQDGRFCYTNPAFQSLTGYREDELLGRNSLDLVVPKDRKMVGENAVKMLRGERTLPYQFRVTHKNGSIKWVMGSVVPTQYHGRRAILGDFIDITAHKQAEEALQAERNKLKSLIDTMEDHITIRDKDYNLIYMAEHAKKLWGDRTGEKCYRIFEDQDKVCGGCPAEKAFRDGKSHTSERKTVTPSGEVLIWETRANPIRDAEGKIIACLEIARDITERKQMEEAQRETEEEKNAFIEEAPIGIIHANLKGKITYVNKRFESDSGYSREEIVGKSGFQLDWFPTDTTKYLAKRMVARLRGGPAKHWETQFKCKDGRWIWIELEGKLLRKSGVPVGFQIIARNVTERKQMEEALQAEKNKLQSLIDTLDYTITIQDTKYNIIYQNEPSKMSSGGDHVGEKCYRAYEGREKVCDGCPVKEAFKDGKSHTSERRTKISGKVAFWENTAIPIRDTGGKIVSCMEVARDITEHKQAEEALKLLSSVTEQVSDATLISAADFNITYANKAAQDLFGYPPEEILGKHISTFNAKPLPKSREQKLEQTLSSDKPWTGTIVKKRKDGSTFLCECHITPLHDDEGRISSYIDVMRDVTERKQAEEALQTEKNKLQSLIDALEYTLTIQDKEYNIIFQNEPARRTFGDHLGEKCYRAYEGKKKVCARCPVEKAFKDGKSHTAERQRVLPSGEILLLELMANPIRDARGRVVSCLALGKDITARKQAEDELQTEKNKLQSLVDAMEDGLSIRDRDYNIIYQGRLQKSIVGDHLGEKCYRVYEGREEICEGCPVEKAFKDGKSHTAERSMVEPSGEISFWENTANPIRDASGEIVSCLEINRNITERKRQEQALADELTRRRLLIDQSLDGIVVLDEDARVVEANQRFAEMLGYTPEEVRELHTWDWDKNFPPEQILEQGRNVDEKGLHLETKHTRKDGSVIDVDISINAAMFGEQKLIFCVCRDVTERNQAEEALKESEENYRELADSITEVFFAMDEHLRYTYWNKASETLTGIRAEDALGKSLWEVFPDTQDLRMAEKVYRAVLRKQQSQTFVNEFDIDGRHYTFEISAYPSKGGISVFARDITKRKEQDQALADELTRRRLLVDQSLDGIVVLDENDKVYEANQRFADMLGYTPEEVRELHTWDWEKNYSREQIHKQGRKADEKGFLLETKHTRKDGSVIDVDISINAAMFGGQKLIFCVCRDVTERKKAEQALADELAQRRLLIDKSLDGIVVLDEDARVVEANQRFADMLGYTLEEVYKLHTWDWDKNFPPEKILEIGRTVDEKGLHLETKHTRKDGSVIDVDISISGIMYGGQKLIFCIQRDVTERKKMEEAINLQRAYFQQLFDNSPDAILMTDLNGKAIQANRGFEMLFGYSNEEAKGRSLIELIVPEGDEQDASDSFQRISDGEVIRKELVRRRKDGSLVDVSVLAYPIHSNGKLIGLYGIYSDITERKRAEEALRIAAGEWRETFDSITDAISIHDKDYKILRANKAFAEMFHLEPKQLLNKHCYELHKGDKPISGCPQKQTMATGKPAAAELYESNLGRYLLESTSPIFDKKGEIIGAVHITRDVTERKQQNERLMMADRLASVGELAAGTAHELNNPLTSVIGFSQLLLEKDIPDDIREDLQLVHSEAQRAANVTRNLLTFARKQAPVKQLNQINNIIEDVLKLRAYEHKANSIEVKKQLTPDLPEIMVDYFQMQQVFLNIIINAEYFMTEEHKRGTLTITTKKQNDNVLISFADDGPGIPPENLSRIFDPFFTTKVAGKGTGLGLSICHGIVSEHGGQIYAKSQGDKGTTISVELPINSHDHIRETP